ncbi:hypothetical protein ACFYT4_16180 [Streptomyces sp. NPDC004609]|uniref:hypothetical protein n=1 Tax=Streptomyces sp. NPDC004609 TaxID=3364704 RepID=UPI0036BE7274
MARYARCFAGPEAVRASCADYRAAAGIDLEHDAYDRGRGHAVDAPLLALWGTRSFAGRHVDVAGVRRAYARDVTAVPVHADHYPAQESPGDVVRALASFCWTSDVEGTP